MKKGMLLVLAALFVLSLGVVACDEDDAADNVAACEDWLDATECGEFDFADSMDCSIYDNTTCDISDYFDCLTENTTCDEDLGIPDVSGWLDCAADAECD